MDSMTPSSPPPPKQPSGAAQAGAVFLGGVVGLIVSVVLSLLMLGTAMGFIGTNSSGHGGNCAAPYAVGVALAVGAIALALLAWYLIARVKGGGFGINFARGLTVTVAVFNLAPWPCSLTGAAYFAFTGCH